MSEYRLATRHDLLISDDTRAGAGDRRKVLALLAPWARDFKRKEPRLGKISVAASLDVLYDIGGESRIFPYVHWSAPEIEDGASDESFSQRAELEGRAKAAEDWTVAALEQASTRIESIAAELSAADAERMAGMFKALADPVRLRLFSRVAAHQSGEASVCDIQNVGVSQPTVSHHLKKLREAGLIISERRGTWVYCRVAPGVLPAMAQMLSPRESSG